MCKCTLLSFLTYTHACIYMYDTIDVYSIYAISWSRISRNAGAQRLILKAQQAATSCALQLLGCLLSSTWLQLSIMSWETWKKGDTPHYDTGNLEALVSESLVLILSANNQQILHHCCLTSSHDALVHLRILCMHDSFGEIIQKTQYNIY